MTFQQKLDKAIEKSNSLLCVGLDPVLEKLPKHYQKLHHPIFEFLKDIVDSTHDLVCCYKPNSAFFESFGEQGIGELKKICDYIKKCYPEIPLLLDFKRGDIGNTNKGYVQFAFDYLGADGITIHPYLGQEAVQPFLDMKEKGIFILCKTSNVGSGEFQNANVILGNEATPESKNMSDSGHPLKGLPLEEGRARMTSSQQARIITNQPLYSYIAQQIMEKWNSNNNCFLVVGATHPEELGNIRKVVGDTTLLVPGVGAQGGEVSSFMKAGLNSKKSGMIINSSREVLYAGKGANFAQKAREKAMQLRDEINTYR